MSDPVFHLSGIVRSRGETEDFEGPLSLILLLLSKNRIEIRDIKISLILDQYMEYLRRMEEMDLEVASEFVAMASHLAYIKSRMLVAPEGEEISELEELIQGLERLRRKDDYEKIRAVLRKIGRRGLIGSGAGCLVPAESRHEKAAPQHRPDQKNTHAAKPQKPRRKR